MAMELIGWIFINELGTNLRGNLAGLLFPRAFVALLFLFLNHSSIFLVGGNHQAGHTTSNTGPAHQLSAWKGFDRSMDRKVYHQAESHNGMKTISRFIVGFLSLE